MVTAGAGAPASTLLVLLVAGHMLGDFVLQTRRMVERKAEWSWLGFHALLVAGAHAAALFPFLSAGVLVVAVALGISHAAIDAVKARLPSAAGGLEAFVLDQAAHGLALVGAWLLLLRFFEPELAAPFRGLDLAAVEDAGLLVAAYAFAWNGGSAIVGGLLARFHVEAAAEDVRGTGRLIGILERTLALTLVLLGEWGTLGLVLAAKSIARFKELEDRSFSEYYLIGTLASLLVAVGAGLLAQWLL